MEKNSSASGPSRDLAMGASAEAKRFLIELANLAEDAKAAERFERRFSDFLEWKLGTTARLNISLIDTTLECVNSTQLDMRHWGLLQLRDALRSIWKSPDLRTKQWQIFLLQADPTMSGPMLSLVPPPLTPFQQAMTYLFKRAEKTRYCHNGDCLSPYFLAMRKSQKYCSEDCALPAQRASKRQWWQSNGPEWRTRKRELKNNT
jgi:hypothetical protein